MAYAMLSPKKHRRHHGRWGGEFLVGGPQGPRKMSETLLDFIQPFRHDGEPPEETAWLVSVGTLAWNACLLPEDEREATTNKLIAEGMGSGSLSRAASRIHAAIAGEPPAITEFKHLLNGLIERKLQHYAGNRRCILGYEILQNGNHLHLNVLSTLMA